MCEMSDSMMQDMEMCKRDMKELRAKLDAVARYLKMTFDYTPEKYEMVKPEDMGKGMGVPMQIR